jgi:glycosyltransferase involved in cell wall biosynthesis
MSPTDNGSPLRVLFVLTDLHGGGAQQVVLTLLRHLPRERFELHLALVRREGRFVGDVPADVRVHDLAAKRVRSAALPLVRLVRELRPATVLSTLFHMNQLLLLLRPLLPRGTRLIVREGITVSQSRNMQERGRLSAGLVRWLYPTADCIVCQCAYMADDLAESFGVTRVRMRTLYNPVDVEAVRERARSGDNPFAAHDPGPHVVAIGRLEAQKGFDLLIDAFPDLRTLRPDAQLWIVGEDPSPGGEARGELERAAAERGIGDHVHLVGFQRNPYAYLAHADLFVLSSRYEGLPNVLLEALAVGCPVVALDRPGGTREIMLATGQRRRLVDSLEWRTEWLRGESPEPPPDLSAFSLERAIATYGDLLDP